MNRKQRITISIVGIVIVSLILIGITYAYFLTQIKGNTNDKSISVTTAKLELIYGDGNGVLTPASKIEPGDKVKFLDKDGNTVESKTFTVTNNGNATVDDYGVVLENFSVIYYSDEVTEDENGNEVIIPAGTVTEFSRPEDFEFVITCKNQDGEECTGFNGTLPTQSEILIRNSIEKDEVQTYTATLTYKEAGVDQSADMNKTISGKFNIIGIGDTVDLTGEVTNYESGDYVQTNSTKRVSAINPDGTYKVLGLEAGEHKIKVCAYNENEEIQDCTDEEAKMIQTLTINKGDTFSVDNTSKTITITETSRLAIVDINLSTNDIQIDEINIYNPYFYNKNSLAYNILNNSIRKKNGTELVSVPYTKVGTEAGGEYIADYEYEELIKKEDLNDEEETIPISELTAIAQEFTVLFSESEDTACSGTEATLYKDTVGQYMCMDNREEKIIAYIKSYDETTDSLTVNLKFREYVETQTKEIKKTEKILSITEDDYGTSYYYRGKVEDNYVNFADMCWRIVRIQGDGSTKLILEDKEHVCNDNENNDVNNDNDYYDGNWSIGTGSYVFTHIAEMGFELDEYQLSMSYGKPTILANFFDNTTNNSMKNSFLSFQSDFTNEELDLLKEDVWCIYEQPYYRSGYASYNYEYSLIKGEKEFINDVLSQMMPNGSIVYGIETTLKCEQPNIKYMQDANETPMYIGALTEGEIYYAGGYGDANENYYLNGQLKRGFYTISPSIFNGNDFDYIYTIYNSYSDKVSIVSSNGGMSATDSSSTYRPAIVLKENISITKGEGTIDNPYVID